MDCKPVDAFWNLDLDVIEATFLGTRKVTDLPVRLDNRVPPQGRVALDRTVNVDKAVDRLLAAQPRKTVVRRPSLVSRLFDRYIFG
jgi:hypothetical protein